MIINTPYSSLRQVTLRGFVEGIAREKIDTKRVTYALPYYVRAEALLSSIDVQVDLMQELDKVPEIQPHEDSNFLEAVFEAAHQLAMEDAAPTLWFLYREHLVIGSWEHIRLFFYDDLEEGQVLFKVILFRPSHFIRVKLTDKLVRSFPEMYANEA